MWRGYQIASLVVGLAGISLSAVAQMVPRQTANGLITDTTVCQLRSSPAEFDHKFIRVNAYLSFGFEERSMLDPFCQENSSTTQQSSNRDERDFWVEFANKAEDEGVEGFLPLVEDDHRRCASVLVGRTGRFCSQGDLGAGCLGKSNVLRPRRGAEASHTKDRDRTRRASLRYG